MYQIFIVVVRNSLSVLVYTTSENCVCQIISWSFHIISSVDEVVRMLCSSDRIQHNREITAGRILHTDRNIHATGSETMLLVLHRTCTYSFIGENIIQIAAVFRIKHLICRRESCLLHNSHVHLADSNNSGKKVRSLIRVWLMKHSFVTVTCGTGLICINSRDDHQFVRDFICHCFQFAYIFADCIFVISGTRSYKDDKFIWFTGEDTAYFFIALFFYFFEFLAERVLRFQNLR